jgi:hypothetical protein
MDTTIRGLDDAAYRSIKARASLEGRPIGAVVSDAMRAYAARLMPTGKLSLLDLKPIDFPPGNENLSEEIDAIVYGT